MSIATSLAHVERIFGHTFINKLVGIEAIHADNQEIYYDGKWLKLRRNDDLAISGDKTIDLIVSILWYRSRTNQNRPLVKGDMSAIQRDLVSGEKLAARGYALGLDAYVIKNPGHVGRISERMMATAVEALIGAVLVDSGHDLEAVRAVMERLRFFEHPLLLTTDCSALAAQAPADAA
ncbi:ribonuclease III domain-containing protein [Boeremia exigua]|uniref:ribonuclease III domain-containing protein n=1 Tax=Boeremia exigua TaxID=749465 RepID=UPI001E8E8635|nr:ribonuclease III domain-containing protein [Boeremia exigua]KAH6643526.1 ribonuclease III domain-containing protein [Boeremia exigua]